MNISYEINDAEFGTISVVTSKRAKRIIFKVRQGRLYVTISEQNLHRRDELLRAIDSSRGSLRRLLARAERKSADTPLSPEHPIVYPEGTIVLAACNWVHKGVLRIAEREPYHLVVYYSESENVASPPFQQAAARLIMRMISNYAVRIFPPLVSEMAARHGLRVKGVRVGRGRGILGSCSSTGSISISAHVMFLPPHLRQYIICHELAHLTYLDHSEAFHRLCDSYCGGNEKAWRKALNQFTFPINAK